MFQKKEISEANKNLIKLAIRKYKILVMDACRKSNIVVPFEISDSDLYNLVLHHLMVKRNGFLLYNLGLVMRRVEVESGVEQKSNFDFMQIIDPIGLFGGDSILGGKKSKGPAGPAGPDPMMLQMQQAAQQAQAEAARRRYEDEQKQEEEDRRRRTNMMIFGIIGAVVVIGGGIAMVVIMKKK